jgi:hypothetical protein
MLESTWFLASMDIIIQAGLSITAISAEAMKI